MTFKIKLFPHFSGRVPSQKTYQKAPEKKTSQTVINWNDFNKRFPKFVGQGLKEVARAIEGAARKSVKQRTIKAGKVPKSGAAGAPYFSRRKGGIAKKFINKPINWNTIIITFRENSSQFTENGWQVKIQEGARFNNSFVERIAKKAANRYIVKHSIKGKKKK